MLEVVKTWAAPASWTMLVDGIVASGIDTHAAWRKQVLAQSDITGRLQHEAWHKTKERTRAVTQQARGQLGDGRFDQHVTETETLLVMRKWDRSPSLPADLVPRVAFTCEEPGWWEVTWLCQRICGPGALARRPNLWRW